MKYTKTMCLILSITLITGCGLQKNKINESLKNNINIIEEKLSSVQAQLIIDSVDVAYMKALGNLEKGVFPTLKQVIDQFDMDDAEMLEDGTIKVNGKITNCKTITDNNKLKISCDMDGTNLETTIDMNLSK